MKAYPKTIAVILVYVLLFAQTALKQQVNSLFLFPYRVVNFRPIT